MHTVGIDHIAMPTADAEQLMAFYKKLGFAINDEEAWRAGTATIFSIQVGDSKINVHPEGHMADYRGPTAVPGCTDICFVWDGTVWKSARKCWRTRESTSYGDRVPGKARVSGAYCQR